MTIKKSLDIFYEFISDPKNLISEKIKLLYLIDSCFKEKNSIFINFFLQHSFYKGLFRYLKYENFYDENRFMLFFNNDTKDYEKAIDFYQFLIILFIKWDNNFGITKKEKTPFRRNLKKLITDNMEIKKYVFYVDSLLREISKLKRILFK